MTETEKQLKRIADKLGDIAWQITWLAIVLIVLARCDGVKVLHG